MKLIDLHLHLDGAITVEIAKKVAAVQNMTLPTEDDKELKKLLTVSPDCKDLNEFLDRFVLPISLLQTKEAMSEAVYQVCENIKSQGVIYAELRFAPQSQTHKGMTQEEAILAALEGLKRTDLKANLILCFMRGENVEKANMETLELARKYLVADGGVVGIDIAGAEALYPTGDYKDLFDKAREYNIPFTIHAGEAAGADSVRKAVEFGAKRIGHAVTAFDDSKLVDEIIDKGIVLEMCPTSNIQTRAVDDMSKYPLMYYLEKGVKVTINTDDMGIEGTTLQKEFDYIEKTFKVTSVQKKELCLNAVSAAFTTDEVKNWLKQQILE